jgi:hypothetical protein
MVVLERPLDIGEGDRAMIDEIIPHVSWKCWLRKSEIEINMVSGVSHSCPDRNNTSISVPRAAQSCLRTRETLHGKNLDEDHPEQVSKRRSR